MASNKEPLEPHAKPLTFQPLDPAIGGDVHIGAQLRQAHALEFIAVQMEQISRRLEGIEELIEMYAAKGET